MNSRHRGGRFGAWRVGAALVAGVLQGRAESPPPAPLVWMLGVGDVVGGHPALVLGAPRAADHQKGIRFNGENDGLILPVNPLAGWPAFTIEVLIRPQAGGAPAQRFLHIEDDRGNRTLMEIRMEADGRWCLDTFLLCGNQRLTLIDRSRLHPPDQWQWVALRCDGRKMDHFVNGVQELEGSVAFTPFGSGRMSLGVRLSREYWFKGVLREVRFHPAAVAAENLQRVP